jgi:cold shock protein
MLARVKWFDKKHGFGFLEIPDHPDIFVHYTSIKGKGFRVLEPGDEVSFRLEKTQKGMQAFDVLIIESASDEENT